MSKTLVLTEKKSVADDFARVLKGFKKSEGAYEREDMIIAWASGHLLELKSPASYDKKWSRWALQDLPIIPKKFEHEPRGGDKRSGDLLKGLVKQLRRPDVERIVNACDAGREGELIFNLILDYADPPKGKKVLRLWLQSMTTRAIEAAFAELAEALAAGGSPKRRKDRSKGALFPSADFESLSDAAYARDEADWLVGMNGTRALTKKFMGRAKEFFAVGRVKTPTLAFLVDREREIDAFVTVPYHHVDATFEAPGMKYVGRWTGQDEEGRKTDRLAKREAADGVAEKVRGKIGRAEDRETRRKEETPYLFDLTSLQREASSRYGYTLDRTLSLVQSLYEAKKAVTYPRTSSRFLPDDYAAEIPRIVRQLRDGPLKDAAELVSPEASPEAPKRVFNDAKVSDHFALIPTGEVPIEMRDDEARIYEMIVRRFLAVFMPAAEWLTVTRETTVEGEVFVNKGKRLAKPGWRAVEPATEDDPLPAPPPDGAVTATGVEVLDKTTQPPARYTDGSLVKAMETSGRDVEHGDALDEETLEEIKEKGIGTPATRASIVKDLIQKNLARREGRSIVATPLGCTLVRVVRNLGLDDLAKPDLTGEWEYRLARMTNGGYTRAQFDAELRKFVKAIVDAVRLHEGGNEEIFARDHGGPLICGGCPKPLMEKTFSYLCSETIGEGDDARPAVNISKNQNGKYLFPETLRRLLKEKRIGPVTGFERTRAPGYFVLNEQDFTVSVELDASSSEPLSPEDAAAEEADKRFESVPEGTVMGVCPKCKSEVVRAGTGYKCVKNIPRAKDKVCDYRLAERIKYRFLPPDQVRKLLSGQKTDVLFGFVSMRGMKFRAALYYDEQGELKWEFPPRPERKPKVKKEGEAEAPKDGDAPTPKARRPRRGAPKAE
jgi:DNA topoisomerase III